MDKELIDQLLADPEFSDLPADLVYGIMNLVGEAFAENKYLTGKVKNKLRKEIAGMIESHAETAI